MTDTNRTHDGRWSDHRPTHIDGLRLMLDEAVDLQHVRLSQTTDPASAPQGFAHQSRDATTHYAGALANDNLSLVQFATQYRDLLQGGSPSTTYARQQAKQWAAGFQKDFAGAALEPDKSTYFARPNAQVNHTLVLGWDHAVVLRRQGGAYRPLAIYAKGNPHLFGDLVEGANGARVQPTALAAANPVSIDFQNQTWNKYTPPNVALDRVTTFGVSGCSVSILGTSANDFEYIAMAHLSSGPVVPVVSIMGDNNVPANTAFTLFASVFPEESEIDKFMENRTLSAATTRGCVALRGPRLGAARYGRGDICQLTHSEIGLLLRNADSPKIEGILGLEQDSNYARLVATTRAMRIKALLDLQNKQMGLLLFDTEINALERETALQEKFERRGFQFRAPIATQRIDDRKWTVTHSTSNNPFTERKYGIKVRTSGPPNNLRYRAYIHSNTEPEDVIADVIRPLMNSTDGFGSIHTAVFEAIVDKLYQERDQPECGKNAFIEANQEMEATSRACAKLQKAQWKLANTKDPERKDETTWQMAAAPLLAHYLTRADHPYDTIIAPIIREHRYGFEIPMRSIV